MQCPLFSAWCTSDAFCAWHMHLQLHDVYTYCRMHTHTVIIVLSFIIYSTGLVTYQHIWCSAGPVVGPLGKQLPAAGWLHVLGA
jgi:hypothetical protein